MSLTMVQNWNQVKLHQILCMGCVRTRVLYLLFIFNG